jgi:hypothetical protein
MKIISLILFLVTTSFALAQTKLPVIKAASKKALIVEGEDDRYNWYLDPKTKPDIHTISKILRPEWIKFYTDIDSIKVKIKPNENFDFIVLLNNKDTCYTRIESLPIKNYSSLQPETHDTIPFVLTEYNNVKIKAIVNTTDTLDLHFDSGTTGLELTNDAIKQKPNLKDDMVPNNSLQIGNLHWDSLIVYPVKLSGHGTDGRFGWDLFDGKIVEINYDRNIFIVHSKRPAIDKEYSKLKIEYLHTLFCIPGNLQLKNTTYNSRFLFDNGYERTIMLDSLLMQQQHYPTDLKVIKEAIMKDGQGRQIPVITVNNERLNLGKQALLNIPVQLVTTSNPAWTKTHILGNEVLKRFNTLLDFQNNYVYLKPNSLFDAAYNDAK